MLISPAIGCKIHKIFRFVSPTKFGEFSEVLVDSFVKNQATVLT